MRIKNRITVVIVLMLSCFFVMLAILTNNKAKVVYAQVNTGEENISCNNLSPQEIVLAIENEMIEQGTSISEVLQTQKNIYENELVIAKVEDQDVINAKIDKINQAIEDIPPYIEFLCHDENGTRMINEPFEYPHQVSRDCSCSMVEEILPPCENCVEYTSLYLGVSAVAAGFYLRGWVLAADLLWFNLSNEEIDCEYWPSLGYRIANSSIIANNIAQNDVLAGSCSPSAPGPVNGILEGEIEGDTYNSLGAFYYSKKPTTAGMIKLCVQDRYDWDKKEGNSTIVFNNILYDAQSKGVVTPFYTMIELDIPGYVPFDWEYLEGGIEITGLANFETGVVIPDTKFIIYRKEVDGNKRKREEVYITSIGENAFANQTQITSVTIPNIVTNIGDSAFRGCVNLTNINLPSSLISIGGMAFRDTGMQRITIPNSVEIIGRGAFVNCVNLTQAHIGSAVVDIEEYAFCNTGLIEITIPNGVESIGDCAFSCCASLAKVTLPESLTNLGAYAFYQCTQLVSVNLPAMITEIKEETFFECVNLASVVIPNGVVKIEDRAFSGCATIGQVIIPNTVTRIGDMAFANCSQIALYIEEYGQRPSGWSSTWAPNCLKVWNTSLSQDNSYVVSFYKQEEFEGSVTRLATPIREGYEFGGWYWTSSFTGEAFSSQSVIQAPTGANYYALWSLITVNIVYKDVGALDFQVCMR